MMGNQEHTARSSIYCLLSQLQESTVQKSQSQMYEEIMQSNRTGRINPQSSDSTPSHICMYCVAFGNLCIDTAYECSSTCRDSRKVGQKLVIWYYNMALHHSISWLDVFCGFDNNSHCQFEFIIVTEDKLILSQ